MTPGSTPWLMAHEIRLAWRVGEGKNRWARLVLVGVLVVAMSASGVPVGLALRGHAPPTPDGAATLLCDLVFAFITLMSFSTALSFVAASFIDRGDIDLLLSSPLPMRRLLTARLAATALRSAALWLFLFGPPVVAAAVIAGPRWLGGLALLFDAGLFGTTVASWLAVSLFRAVGAQRVKTVTTLITTLSGLSAGLASPFYTNVFGAPKTQPSGWLSSLPARALFGDLAAAAILSAATLALFLLTTWLLAPSFARVARHSDGKRRRSAGMAPLRGFGGGLFPLLLLKDCRLLLRNHALLMQILARSIAFIPLLVINASRGHTGFGMAGVAFPATMVLAQTAGALVWAVICTESLPDLLASAPHPPALFRRSRLVVALLPTQALVIAAAALMATYSGIAGLAVLLMGTGACLSSVTINTLAKAGPVRTTAWGGKVPRPSLPAVFTDMIASGLWGYAAYLLTEKSIWTALPVWLALSTVWLWREITRRES
jgi:ABC-2 type transport system permease protein